MRRRDFTKTSLSALGALSLGRVGSFPFVGGADASRRTGTSAPPLSVNGDRLNAHLATLLNNYVNMARFYDPKACAIFRVGTLYMDARACSLCRMSSMP